MTITLQGRNETRVKDAMMRRAELLKMRTADMPRNYIEELARVNMIIAAAVAYAAGEGAVKR